MRIKKIIKEISGIILEEPLTLNQYAAVLEIYKGLSMVYCHKIETEDFMNIVEAQELIKNTPPDTTFTMWLSALTTIGDAIENGYVLCKTDDMAEYMDKSNTNFIGENELDDKRFLSDIGG